MSSPSLIDKDYEAILSRFKADIMPEILGNLQALKINTTGALRDSLHMSINKSEDAWEISFQMLASGKIIHKQERFAQHASAKELAQWIKVKGLQHFKYIPGYENSNMIPDDAHERLAWAIKKSKKKNRHSAHTPGAYSIYAIDFNAFASWFYKPYFSRWGKASVELIDTYFSTTTEALSKEIGAVHSFVA